jgi:hypothetical protein
MLSSQKHAVWLFVASPFLIIVSLLFTLNGVALAHGKSTVGDYELTIGFHNEPVIQGEKNSLDLFVVNTKTNEKINGLDQTLHAEIIFGTHKKELPLYPQEDQDGAYAADVIPTRVGDYTWHIWGDIKGTPADVSMTGSPTTFGTVDPKSGISFPDVEPSTAALADQARAAGQSAQTALIVGIAGVVLGLAGIAMRVMGLQAARRS